MVETKRHSIIRVELKLPAFSPGDLKLRFEKRNHLLKKISDYLGIDMHTVSADEFLDGSKELPLITETPQVVWWGGRIASLVESKELYSSLCRQCEEAGKSTETVQECPEYVEESRNLSLYYPILKRAGVPQATTRLFALPELKVETEEKEIRRLIEEKLDESVTIDEPCFLRTFYGTKKFHPGLNFVFSRESLINKATELLHYLHRKEIDFGGIAIREALDIRTISQKENIFCEYRVFSVFGKAVMWFVDSDMEKKREFFELASEPFLASRHKEQIETLLPGIAGALQSKFLCLDFAVLSDDSVVLLEVNPGHSSGWVHDIALIGVYGQFFRKLVGLEFLDAEECLSIARTIELDSWGKGISYDFMID